MVKTDLETTSRPPVVALMGHIDHGKTSLLDRIRQSRLQNQEAGGITQHVSAYQTIIDGQKITFIDTPGHKAFENMRARGAKITDLAVLVIAADEGIKPQTKECLEHIKNSQVPFLIALNKIDLPGVNQEEIKNKLTQFGVVTEDRGGDVVLVPVSAKTGQGIDELLEMIVLLAQMNELDYHPEKPFLGVVLESLLNAQKGVLVTVIVKQGKLVVGQEIASREEKIKVRALFNDLGQPIKEAVISQPVSILGFTRQPMAGSLVGDPTFIMASSKSQDREKNEQLNVEQEGALLNLVVKADTQGTLEALISSLPKEKIAIIKSGVGDINDSDIFMASSGRAEVVGFDVNLPRRVVDLAKAEKVNVKVEKIIYQLLQYIEERLATLETIKKEKSVIGQAKIVADFAVPQGRVAGAKVVIGLIRKGAEVVVAQAGGEKETKIASLQRGREKVDQVEEGQEFGALFSPAVDFKIGDMIKYYQS
ncbi:MAG: translation initiation factor IF-2 [Microgenomates bacterium 39_6]|nr:MAG: translation initiation factor IF-2 [Microgenomates bacterium 39_6]